MMLAVSVNGQSFPVKLESSSTISDLKAKIQDVIIAQSSSSSSHSYVLDDDRKSIADCNICDGSTLFLHTSAAANNCNAGPSFHIRVMSLKGNRYMKLQVHGADTISAVKSRIEARVGRPLPAGCIVSTASGRRLRDGDTTSRTAPPYPPPPILWGQQQPAARRGFELGIYCEFVREYTFEVRSTDTDSQREGADIRQEASAFAGMWAPPAVVPGKGASRRENGGRLPIENHPDLEMIFEFVNGFPFLF
ncbi:hypothetical protein M569_09134 [Genlisea aurea]|uniref:Ubiquitin-like domain-containing protein n=1 Tax=Genlisea aurea TaxID=192259 RepID=S8CFD4_9LAMI|nr:hypothetical protein M569_09134 [Genlisea aurea]